MYKIFLFWYKTIRLEIINYSEIDYEKSYYDLISDKSIGGLYGFPKYCYDKIILKRKDGEVEEFYVNTLMFSFKKAFLAIQERIRHEHH